MKYGLASSITRAKLPLYFYHCKMFFPFHHLFHFNGWGMGYKNGFGCEDPLLWWFSDKHLWSVDFEPKKRNIVALGYLDFCESNDNEGKKQNIDLKYSIQ